MKSIIRKIAKFVELKLELFKIDIQEGISDLLSNIFKVVILATIIVIFVFFASLTLAIVLNNLLDSKYLGFLIISLVYLILFFIVYQQTGSTFLEKKITRNVRAFFNKKEKIDYED